MEFDVSPPAPPDATRPTTDHVRVILAGYLAWILVIFIAEWAGRRGCQVPKHLLSSCLDATAWYSYLIGGMFSASLIAPFVVVWLLRKKIFRLAMSHQWFTIKAAVIMYFSVFFGALFASLGPFFAAQWFYDRFA